MPVELVELGGHGRFELALYVHIEGRKDAQPFRGEILGPILLLQLALHEFHEGRITGDGLMRIGDDIQRMGFRLLGDFGVDEALPHHLVKDQIAALEYPVGKFIGIVIGRPAHQRYQQGDVVEL